MSDTRIKNSLPAHPKCRRLIRRHGQAAGWNLICLFLFTTQNRPNGDLSGMDNEEIEIAADWLGEPNAFVNVLVEIGFLDGHENEYVLHDWEEHNPWAAGFAMRSAKARWNITKRHYGEAEADAQVPEYAAIRKTVDAINTDSITSSNTPLLTDSLPIKKPKAPKAPPSVSRFDEFWALYPKKADKFKCGSAWAKLKCDAEADMILAACKKYIASVEDLKFIKNPLTWLNGKCWNDEVGIVVGKPAPVELTDEEKAQRIRDQLQEDRIYKAQHEARMRELLKGSAV